jgi:hypothetical protein
MLLDSIVKLHDKIQNMKLGVNREREITELEEARLRRLPLAVGTPQTGLVKPGGRSELGLLDQPAHAPHQGGTS